MAGEAQTQSQPCLPLPVCSAQTFSGSGEAHPCWYCRHWTTKRHTPPRSPCLLAWALAHSWCFINVRQERIREKPADRWRQSPTDRIAHGPAIQLCFPEALSGQRGREGRTLLAVFWTCGAPRGRPVSTAWCPPGSLQLAGGPGGQRGIHRGEGARTEGSKAVIRGCCLL